MHPVSGEGAEGSVDAAHHLHLPHLPHVEHRAHHAHPGLRWIIIKVAMFTALSVVITSIVVTSLLDLDVHPTRNFAAIFSDAAGLQQGDTVRVAGVEVGKVAGVSLINGGAVCGNTGTGCAKISFSLDNTQHPTTTSTATIHFENLLGQRYLAILPGSSGGAPLRSGSVIPLSQTTPALNLTEVFDGFQPLFSALAPSQVNQLSASIIAVFGGESSTVSSLVSETAAITNNLADRQAVLNGLLTSLASLLNAVGVHDTQLGDLIGNFDTLVRGLASSKTQLGSAIDNLSTLTSTVGNLLNQTASPFHKDFVALVGATATLQKNQGGINSLLQGFPGLINAVAKIGSDGSWINAYVCNLTVNLVGSPLNIALVPGATFPTYPANITLGGLIGHGPTAIGTQSIHTASCS